MSSEKTIYQKALDKWGLKLQLIVAIEECSELIHSITRWLRCWDSYEDAYPSCVAEEIADLELMMEQIKQSRTYLREEIKVYKDSKLKRLGKMLDD